QPLPGGVVPPFFIHPTAARIVALYPLPNRNVPFANYVSSPILKDDIDQFDAKLEHTLGAETRLGGRFSFSDRRLLWPFARPGGGPTSCRERVASAGAASRIAGC